MLDFEGLWGRPRSDLQKNGDNSTQIHSKTHHQTPPNTHNPYNGSSTIYVRPTQPTDFSYPFKR